MRVALIVLLVASSVVAGVGRLGDTLRLTLDLGRLPDLESRRVHLFGPWYAAVQQLRREIPPGAAVDFVMLTPEARDIAVLGAAELQPRDVRLFDGWEAWRRRERATLLHDARAANAAPAPPPAPARFIVAVDPAAHPPLRIVKP